MERTTSDLPGARAGLIAGAVGALLMTVVLIALRLTLDAMVITELMADWFTRLLPAPVFDFFIEKLLFNAKRLLYVLVFLGQIGVGGLIGVAYAKYVEDAARQEGLVKRASYLALGVWAVLALALTPLLGGGFLGSNVADGPLTYSLALLFAVFVFALTTTQILALADRAGGMRYNAGRRDFLQKAGVFAALAVVGGIAVQTVLTNLSRLAPSVSRPKGRLSTPVTPNDEFYLVSKSAVVSNIDVGTWTLGVEGDRVGNPMQITYDELLAMPAIEEYVTLTCISNPIGGDLISNALWKGVPLKLILDEAKLAEGTERIAFYAHDGYFDSFPLDIARRDEVIVAYNMNGVPLPDGHGFPARIIVPGLYGMENVKWLDRIEPVDAGFRGYWQRRGWQDTAVIKTMSRFDIPTDNARLPVTEVEVGGVAFAGTRGISRIEVSLDDGATWRDAEFEPALSDYAWVIWRVGWPSPMPGRPTLMVRATDGSGTRQDEIRRANLPSGATGWHRIDIVLTEPPTPTPPARPA